MNKFAILVDGCHIGIGRKFDSHAEALAALNNMDLECERRWGSYIDIYEVPNTECDCCHNQEAKHQVYGFKWGEKERDWQRLHYCDNCYNA